ncbi:MAG: hypothetical protein V7K83_18840 [Nostoc sp.]
MRFRAVDINTEQSPESDDERLPTVRYAIAIIVLSTIIPSSDHQIAASVSLGTDK